MRSSTSVFCFGLLLAGIAELTAQKSCITSLSLSNVRSEWAQTAPIAKSQKEHDSGAASVFPGSVLKVLLPGASSNVWQTFATCKAQNNLISLLFATLYFSMDLLNTPMYF